MSLIIHAAPSGANSDIVIEIYKHVALTALASPSEADGNS